ncbi:unnamed protein product, partial [Brenthis ino]
MLNLAVQQVLGSSYLNDLISKVKAIISYFKRSNLAWTKLKKKQEQANKVAKRPIQDVVTGWNSTLYMLNRIVELKDEIKCALSNLDTGAHILHYQCWAHKVNLIGDVYINEFKELNMFTANVKKQNPNVKDILLTTQCCFPSLAKAALQSIWSPTSSVDAERFFSKYNVVVTDQRTALKESNDFDFPSLKWLQKNVVVFQAVVHKIISCTSVLILKKNLTVLEHGYMLLEEIYCHYTWSKRLAHNAIPTLHLPGFFVKRQPMAEVTNLAIASTSSANLKNTTAESSILASQLSFTLPCHNIFMLGMAQSPHHESCSLLLLLRIIPVKSKTGFY